VQMLDRSALDVGAVAAVFVPPPGSRTIPPLVGDPLKYAEADLASRGYPPRPDPVATPDAYARWLARVSKTTTLIDSPTVSVPDIVPGTFATTNWSGADIHNSVGTKYNLASGEFQVPNIESHGWEQSVVEEETVSWVGLDGCGQSSTDLMQSGVDQYVWISNTANPPNYAPVAVAYNAWAAWIGTPSPYRAIPSSAYPVYVGDYTTVTVWVGNSQGVSSLTGGFMWFDIYDDQQDFDYRQCIGPSSSCTYNTSSPTFVGDCAEWIEERPGHGSSCQPNGTNCSHYDLANFGSVIFSYPYARGSDRLSHDVSTDPYDVFWIYPNYPSGNELAGATVSVPPNGISVTSTWDNYHP
jgi:Peptidase A4 family